MEVNKLGAPPHFISTMNLGVPGQLCEGCDWKKCRNAEIFNPFGC